MNIYLLRHASAGTRRSNPVLDAKRPLDKEGKQLCIQLAQVLSALNVQFDLVVSSPLKRSLQTAALVGTELGYEAKILISKALAPEGTVADFHKLIETCGSYENVLVVGHNPNLSTFLGSLIVPSNGVQGHPATLRLRKGSIARVNCERRPASLQWLLDPRVVRALYTSSAKSSRRKTPRK
ncbi:MAG: SixA phosphatase family protein [Acidobacteriaceae bacterium]